jgi:hypothetical protein
MYNPYDEVEINETNIIDTREDLLWELHTTGTVFVLGHKVTIFELLEEMDQEEKDNVFSMLVTGNEDAKEFAIEKLMDAFKWAYNDSVIEEHYIDMQSEY